MADEIKGIIFLILGLICLLIRIKYPSKDLTLAGNLRLVIAGVGFMVLGILYLIGYF